MFLKKGSNLLKSLIVLSSLVILLFQTSPVMAVKVTANEKPATAALKPIEQLGKDIFFDKNLSSNGMMSCATCHTPEVGFVGPDSDINATSAVYPGAVHTRFGNRKPPTAAYGGYSPILSYNEEEESWSGGMFWDGRATGWTTTLADPLAEQSQGPFLNPLEMNMPNAKLVCIRVAQSDYAKLFEQVWGKGSLDFIKDKDIDLFYKRIAQSIAAYERSAEVNPFTSKYDAYLKGDVGLSPKEEEGLKLFEGKGKCSACHISESGSKGSPPLFTDFTYDNLGLPKNPGNPYYSMPKNWNPDGKSWVDYGLGGFLKKAGKPYQSELGKFKVPTLRNVDLRPNSKVVKVYGHNGYFKSLKEIVHFYNTRDVEKWPVPEYAETMNTDELGNLRLTDPEEDAIVAFMKTLSDGYSQ